MKADRFFVGRPFKFGVDQRNTNFLAPSALACIVNAAKSQRVTAATTKNSQLAIIKDRNENLKYIIQGTNKMQLWQYRLLVTARLLYMFRTLSASIIRSTKTVVAATGHESGSYISSKDVQGRLSLHYVIDYF